MESLPIKSFIIVLLQWHCFNDKLNKYEIYNAKQRGAVCNDRSPGIYYLATAENSTSWIIYFEGGGGCNDITSCNDRFRNSPHFMSSKLYPDVIQTRNILSSGIFKNYNKVILVYCSSDFWLANDSRNNSNNMNNNDIFPGQKKSNENVTDLYTFRGTVIVDTILYDLERNHSMKNCTKLVVVGSSSGGIGAINHLNHLKNRFKNSKVFAILDSSWFINYDNYFIKKSNENFLWKTGILENNACRDMSWNFPCCLSVSCMYDKNLVPKSISLLVLISKYDVYVLSDTLLDRMKDDKKVEVGELLLHVNSYGGQMLQSLDMVKQKENFYFYFASCLEHVYLESSNLWDSTYQRVVEYNYHSIKVIHTVASNHWKTVGVDGVTIHDYINKWFYNVSSSDNNNKDFSSILDTCTHVQCNPTCPRMIYFDNETAKLGTAPKPFLLVVIVAIILTSLFTKFFWTFKHVRLNYYQENYLAQNYSDKDSVERVACLPPCALHDSVGIACSGLQYDILSTHTNNNINNDNNKTEEGEERVRKKTLSLRSITRGAPLSPKQIISGVTAYFNPGQLVAIMGPSGAGKTTLLDVLTARRHFQETEVSIFLDYSASNILKNRKPEKHELCDIQNNCGNVLL